MSFLHQAGLENRLSEDPPLQGIVQGRQPAITETRNISIALLDSEHRVQALEALPYALDCPATKLQGLVKSRADASGTIKVHVDRIFPMEKVKEAFLARESGRVRGKVVLSFT
jgi:hypothetical protein